MSETTYWIFFGVTPATILALGWGAVFLNEWSIKASRRKADAKNNQP